MSEYNWCHGPSCHIYTTTDRVRGSKGSKVLRTRKIKQQTQSQWYDVNNSYNYFCSQGCQNDFWRTHGNAIRQIAPRHEPLETRIEDPEKTEHSHEYASGAVHKWTTTTINKIDNESNVG
jgi:hypothetical protein